MTLARSKQNNYKLENRGDNMTNNTTTNLEDWLPTAWALETLERMGYTYERVQYINDQRCMKNAYYREYNARLARGE